MPHRSSGVPPAAHPRVFFEPRTPPAETGEEETTVDLFR